MESEAGGVGEAGEADFESALHAGESLEEEFPVGRAAVGVTDRRLLVRQDGHLRAVDLTNVRGVDERTLSERGHVSKAVQWSLLGAFLLVARIVAPLEGLTAEVGPAPEGRFEALYSVVSLLAEILRYADEAFILVGALALAWAGRHAVGYLVGRRTVLAVDVAGADPIHLPPPAEPTAVDRLRGAVASRADREE